jgi:hypothetical protein
MPDKKKPIDLSHLGGRQIHHFVPEKSAKEISVEHIGGRRVGGHIAPPEEHADESNSETAAVKSADKPELSGLLAAGHASSKTANKGKFAEIGAIEHRPAHDFDKPEKPIDLKDAGGVEVLSARRGK